MEDKAGIDQYDKLLAMRARHAGVIATLATKIVLPARAACITFDDGYADNVEVALPILQRHSFTATFFISTGFLDGGRMWNDTIIESVRSARQEALDLTPIGLPNFFIRTVEERRETISRLIAVSKYLEPAERGQRCAAIREIAGGELPDDLMLRAEQVRTLHNVGMGIGVHPVTHPILARLPSKLAKREISDGRAALEAMIGAPVRLFAYPNGRPGVDYHGEHVNIVRSLGFDGAVSTGWGAASRRIDPYQLPRFTPWIEPPDGWPFDSFATFSRLSRRFNNIQYAGEISGSCAPGCHSHSGGIGERCAPSKEIANEADECRRDSIRVIEGGNVRDGEPPQRRAGVPSRIRQSEDGAPGTQVLVELCRNLFIAVFGLHDQKAVGGQHFRKGLPVRNWGCNFDHVEHAVLSREIFE